MPSATETMPLELAGAQQVSSLIVAWQDPESRIISPVGRLEQRSGTYSFRYLRRAVDVQGFRPFIGFPDLGRSYESSRLFPLFRQRVMDPKRRDYARYLETLGLGDEAAPMEVLGRSGGVRHGDAIMLFPPPLVQPDGRTEYSFLVHGVRHMAKFGVEERLARLEQGDELLIVDEPSNPMNQRALVVTSTDGHGLGWVPDLLLEYVHKARETASAMLYVERTNGPDTPWHLRLCVRLAGAVPRGWKPFEGPGWESFPI